jgi:hypothetical protein
MPKRRVVHLVVWSIATLATAVGEAPSKRACNASTLGKMYPAQANSDPQVRNELFTCGELQVCTRGRWRYRWVPLSVRIDQLTKDKAHRPARCVALMQDLGTTASAEGTAPVVSGEN